MDDVVADINYSSTISKYDKYRKNGGQKKSLEECKQEYKICLLRGEVKDALGAPGTTPPQPTVKFELLTKDITIFLGYIAEMRKDNGGLLKPGAYASFRSSLQYLFFRCKHDVPSRYAKELKNAMEGVNVKRYTNTAVGSIFDGDAALPWALYKQFNRWFLAKGEEDGIFAACFSKLTCNLACQGSSTSQICTKHIQWVDDSVAIPFAHGKDQQTHKFQLCFPITKHNQPQCLFLQVTMQSRSCLATATSIHSTWQPISHPIFLHLYFLRDVF
jgi:hypothetical protein